MDQNDPLLLDNFIGRSSEFCILICRDRMK
jgi:hypothetical protein